MNICVDCSTPISREAQRCRQCAQSQNNYVRWAGNDPRREKLRQRNQSVRNGRTPYEDREWLRVRYEDQDMTMREIADEAGCGLRTVARWLRTHDIASRQEWSHAAGANHPSWKGGLTAAGRICPLCGGRKAYDSKRCRKCYFDHNRGPNHYRWRGIADVMVSLRQWCSKNWRPLVYARDGYRCQDCGDNRGGNLHAHHLKPLSNIVQELRQLWDGSLDTPPDRLRFLDMLITNSAITSLDNGVTLCEKCHQSAHGDLHVYRKPKQPHGRKISLEEREDIAYLYAAGGLTQQQLADIYGLSQPYISYLIRTQHVEAVAF